MNFPDILTRSEAAAYLRIGKTTLWKRQNEGEYKGAYFYDGTRLFYVRKKLEEWANEQAQKGA